MIDPKALLEKQIKMFSALSDVDGGDVEVVVRHTAAWAQALLAVLDLHTHEVDEVWPDPDAPEGAPWPERHSCAGCSHYQGAEPWPCPTVRAITTALEAS